MANARTMKIVKEVLLWLVTLFLALVCLRSGLMKMPGIPGVEFWIRDFQRWGYPDWFRIVVGVAELASFALLLVPRLASYGAAIFGVVMIGAAYTHVVHNETTRLPFIFLLIALSLIVMVARRRVLIARFRSTVNG
jgi:uncharacterized membrane protein YphA (DoxX/SURF4 family)